jgi:hypothetical protein
MSTVGLSTVGLVHVNIAIAIALATQGNLPIHTPHIVYRNSTLNRCW